MEHRIQSVKALQDYILEAVFFDGTVIHFDTSQLFDIFPVFKYFETDKESFLDVKVDIGGYGVLWSDELDLDAESIWHNGKIIGRRDDIDYNYILANSLLSARKSVNMTQNDLAHKSGMHQAEISKIERGIANPSVGTLIRLADAMDMKLKIEFISK